MQIIAGDLYATGRDKTIMYCAYELERNEIRIGYNCGLEAKKWHLKTANADYVNK